MQVMVLCRNKNQAEFVQKGLFYENVGTKFGDISDGQPQAIQYISTAAILILSNHNNSDIDLVKSLRTQYPQTPIVILSTYLTERFDSLARQAGCNLLFSRPYSYSQIALQLKYLVYSPSDENTRFLIAGSFKLDLHQHLLYQHSETIFLRNKEFSLLEFLILNKNRVLSRTEIYENVWDRNDNICTNTVDVHISNLRRKITPNSNFTYIKTIYCVGYLFDPSGNC